MPDQFDLLFLQVDTTKVGRTPQLVPTSYGEPTKIVTGLQKTIQAFLSLLLTKSGEAWNPTIGCRFLAHMEQGKIRTELDAYNYFAQATPGVLRQVNRDAVYTDEILASAVLIGVLVERTRMSLRIQLTTAAGDTAVFQAPI